MKKKKYVFYTSSQYISESKIDIFTQNANLLIIEGITVVIKDYKIVVIIIHFTKIAKIKNK